MEDGHGWDGGDDEDTQHHIVHQQQITKTPKKEIVTNKKA